MFFLYKNLSSVIHDEPKDPCRPSPCGPYSHCRNVDGHAVCSCVQNYIGAPPNCRPECIVSSECAPNRACINQKCKDPCPGTCGHNARCQVVNHNPVCSCEIGYTGDPFISCTKERKHFLSSFSFHNSNFLLFACFLFISFIYTSVHTHTYIHT